MSASEAGPRVVSPAPRDVWKRLLGDDPRALVTQSPAWLDARCRYGGQQDASRMYELGDGRRLVLPLVRSRAPDERLSLRSSFGEGWGMGGLLAPGGVQSGDVEVVAADLARQPGLRTLIRPNPLLAEEWAGAARLATHSVPRLGHVLDLAGGFEEVWEKRYTGVARRNVHKAERAGVVVERGSAPEHLAAFRALTDQSLARWSSKQHEPLWLARLRANRRDPASKFDLLARSLGEAFSVWLAKLDGRPIAASIVLRGANAHYTRGAMDAELAGPSRANYLLHTAAIRDACEAGCRHYHLGETGTSTSLAFFKTRFGAEPYPYCEYRFERLPLTSVDRRLRAGAKRILRVTDPE